MKSHICLDSGCFLLICAVALLACLPCRGGVGGPGPLSLPEERCRVIVSTDIGGDDNDDYQSMVHFLLYADVFDVEGLLSSPPAAGRAANLLEVIDAYEQDYPNLRQHAPAYPEPDTLRALVKQGATDASPAQGFSESTDASNWLIERAHAEDDRPLYVMVWGSITDVAQAVHDDPSIKAKLRVYSIGSWNTRQDPMARQYLYDHHPDLWWIESDTAFRGMYIGGNQGGDLGNKTFLDTHVRGHGALGELLVEKLDAIKMGDTPSVLYFLRGDAGDPTAPHWGGSFELTGHGPHYWHDAADPALAEGRYPGAKTVNQWREAYLRDWQARMDRVLPMKHTLISPDGWFVHNDRVIWGWIQHNGWWRPGQRPNLARRSVGDPLGDVRPNRTEDLDALTDSMLRYGYPGFEHNFGLWYDRRRDAHDVARRTDPNVRPPFLEQPWARSTEGTAADGLPKYDLTAFNPWYFERLRQFADSCDAKGTVLFHKFYMQHNLLETQAHYVDFPWRPANCVQDTGLPDQIPAANAFYDVSNPTRAQLHRLYIRKCLEVLGDNTHVVYLTSQEFTGPLPFVQFWIDTIAEWEWETGKHVCVALSAPKDVQDAVLADSARADLVDVIDLRNWWLKADGELFAPEGGREIPGRDLERGSKQAAESTAERIYEKIRGYRDRYPGKAITDAIEGNRQQCWAFLMAGGGMLVRGGISYPNDADPTEYIQPADVDIILPTYALIRDHLAKRLPQMRPADLAQSSSGPAWCLADGAGCHLVYALQGGSVTLDASAAPGPLRVRRFDPRDGAWAEEPDAAPGRITLAAPDTRDWVWLVEVRE